ncbi:G-type lectin S-receptor-like serine/threonine-protein kinase At2g19130 [Selaginella moellendorffii]|nr:G-type lectin S-receptor-like serine/threonine-protein kinase At2g19130 [Selaginella moellendorffii]|eukprot:XP_024545613.1 G-type lectin S-receptor-like serine/threonine-protein kinase At2g19130 [Selaginella moellendorffii]
MQPFLFIFIVLLLSFSLLRATPHDVYAMPNTIWRIGYLSNIVIKGPIGFLAKPMTLGFSTPCVLVSCKNDPLYYLSISMPIDSPDSQSQGATVVWRATPRPVRLGAYLNFTIDGDLVLRDFDGSFVWSTGTANAGAQMMTLESSGNLVIQTDSGSLLWQSFDHPTDALLPGQILKPGMKLVATKTNENKEPGYFSLEVKLSSVVLYSTLPAYGELWSSDSKDISTVVLSNSNLQIRKGYDPVDYYTPTFSTVTFSPVTDLSGYQLLKLYPDGGLRFTSQSYSSNTSNTTSLNALFTAKTLPPSCGPAWLPREDQCDCLELEEENSSMRASISGDKKICKFDEQPQECGKYDFSQHEMVEARNYYYNDHAPFGYLYTIHNVTPVKCRALCINNCTCKAVLIDEKTSTCFQMSEVFALNRTHNPASPALSLSLKVHHAKLPFSRSFPQYLSTHKRAKPVIVVVLSATTIGIIIVAIVIWKKQINSYLKHYGQSFPSGSAEDGLRDFTYSELYTATKGFSNKIGSGGFGVVYEGVLQDGFKVAVKRIENSNQGHKQFKAEVRVIGSINHKNLVQLKGFCSHSACYFLVYEYVANGSLDKWIYSQEKLGWDTRFAIIVDIAKGISYLHDECTTRVLHLDIKPQNILLDENFGVKIADFGLSRMVEKGEMSNVMTMVRGTPGYMAPEWLQLRVSDKLDVYSFGIVVLEVATGLQALHTCVSCGTSPRFLATWIVNNLRTGKMVQMLDKKLQQEMDDTSRKVQVEKLLRIGVWCIQPDPRQRPAMVDVVKMLEGSAEVSDPPLPPPEACNKVDTSLSLNILMEMINQQMTRPRVARGCLPLLTERRSAK